MKSHTTLASYVYLNGSYGCLQGRAGHHEVFIAGRDLGSSIDYKSAMMAMILNING